MARVQCFDCDMPVVVDPHGRCPEGHDLGPVGERIEQSLGRAEPHPDEPQPWIAVLDTDEVASAPADTTTPRPARPISVGPEPSDEERSGSTDGLLQELHDLHGSGATPAGDRAGGLSIAPSSQPDDAPTADGPPAPEAAAPWDDWDDWDDWTNAAAEATTDIPAAPSDVAEDPASGDPTPEHPAPEDTPAELTSPEAGEPAPAPSPRRAPTVRSEESLNAMAELAALLGDDGPAPSAPTTPSPAPAADPPHPSGAGSTPAGTAASEPPVPPAGSHGSPTPPTSPTPKPPPAGAQHTPDGSGSAADHGDRLATVSQLPVRPRPFDDDQAPPPPLPAPPVDEEPSPGNDQVASGETIDWTNFTAKGKKRRFGR